MHGKRHSDDVLAALSLVKAHLSPEEALAKLEDKELHPACGPAPKRFRSGSNDSSKVDDSPEGFVYAIGAFGALSEEEYVHEGLVVLHNGQVAIVIGSGDDKACIQYRHFNEIGTWEGDVRQCVPWDELLVWKRKVNIGEIVNPKNRLTKMQPDCFCKLHYFAVAFHPCRKAKEDALKKKFGPHGKKWQCMDGGGGEWFGIVDTIALRELVWELFRQSLINSHCKCGKSLTMRSQRLKKQN